MLSATDQALPVFVRYTAYNPHAKVPAGQSEDPSLEWEIWTLGFNYRPHANIALKFDYEMRDNRGEGATDRNKEDKLSLGMGFVF